MGNLKRRLLSILRYAVYPVFYLTCLLTFFYLTFPWDRLKERVVAEFAATQTMKGSEAQRLEIGTLSGYWITGIEIENAKLIVPPSAAELAAADLATRSSAAESLNAIAHGTKTIEEVADAAANGDDGKSGTGDDEDDDGATKKKDGDKKAGEKVVRGPKESVLLIERATARLQILPLLLGRLQVKFDVEAFGGEIHGSLPVRGKGDIDIAVDHIDLAQIPLVKKAISLPLRGILSGELTLAREEGKLSKSDGTLKLTIDDAILGDGKSKLMNMISLPAAKLGKVELAAEAEKGLLKISKLSASGDLDLSAEGSVKLKEKWKSSVLDLFLRVKLSDDYRNKDDKTKLIFGEPGSKIPGMIDSQPKIKRAKRDDDSYGIHVYGSLKSPKYEPWTGDDATSTAASKKKDREKANDEVPDPFKRTRPKDRTPKMPGRSPYGGAGAPGRSAPGEGIRPRQEPLGPADDSLVDVPLQEPEAPPVEDDAPQEAPPEEAPQEEAPPQ